MGFFDALKKTHKAVYQEEQPMTFSQKPVSAQVVAALNAAAAYTPTLTLGATQTYTTAIYGQKVNTPHYQLGQQGVGFLQAGTGNNNVNPIYQPLPSPTGLLSGMYFTDAGGSVTLIQVDQAYAQILTMISQYHQHTYGNSLTRQAFSPNLYSNQSPMLEGDFSLDEMAEAEQLMEEMSGQDHSRQQA